MYILVQLAHSLFLALRDLNPTPWHSVPCRIVLDEAHTIRNRRTEMSRACCALQGGHHWLMTGTPIVNSAEDVFQLFKFLWYRYTPHAALQSMS